MDNGRLDRRINERQTQTDRVTQNKHMDEQTQTHEKIDNIPEWLTDTGTGRTQKFINTYELTGGWTVE